MNYEHIIREHAMREVKDWKAISIIRTAVGEDIFWPIWNLESK